MKKGKNNDTIKKVLKYIKNTGYQLYYRFFFAAVTVVLTLYLPILTGDAVDYMIGKGQVDFEKLAGLIGRMAVIICATGISQWIMNICNNKITYKVVKDIREDAFSKMEILPLKYLDAHAPGDIVSRIIADADQFADGLLMGFTQAFTGVLSIIGTLLFMLSINVWITLVVVIVTPLSFFVAGFISRRTYKMFQLQSAARGEQTSLIDEMVGSQKVVQAYSHEDAALEKFSEINGRLKKYSLDATFYSSITNPATRFVNNLVYAGVGITGALFVLNGYLTVGGLSCFLGYANQYTKPFNEISGVITELQNALACAARVFELIEEEPQVPDDKDAKAPDTVKGEVVFDNVHFSYVPDKKLITGFNLHVKPGQRVAIVGPTGCGKTTVINLVMRFYDVGSGSIKVDGTDIRHMTRQSLRGNIGMVLQETWIKDGTIFDNIVIGKPDATKEEAIEAAKASHAHSFIKRLPDGYDTIVKEDGSNLSQGQKQLLCIARVMLCSPPMLILDEATSSIDTRTELKIQNAFAKLMEGRTSFIVAHRLSTIQNADIILVMKDGNIIEQGNHENLLKKGGFYANLYNSQFA